MTTDSFSEKRIHESRLRLRAEKSALLVVDMLNEFLMPGGKMVLEGGEVLYPPLNQLLDTAHQAHIPVFWLNQSLRPDDKLFEKRIPHCLIGTWGAQIVDALRQSPDDIVVPKRRYSGFFQTDLDLYLRERKVETVIVSGVVTNICVRSTIHDAFFLGYDVVVPFECVAATNPMAQESSLYDIDTHYGSVTNLTQLLPLLRANPEHAAA